MKVLTNRNFACDFASLKLSYHKKHHSFNTLFPMRLVSLPDVTKNENKFFKKAQM